MSQSDNRTRQSTYRKSSSQERGRSSRTTGGRRPTATNGGRSAKTYGGRYSGRGSKRRKPHYDMVKIIIGIIILVLAVSGIVLAAKLMGDKKSPDETVIATIDETELQKEVSVDGVPITGMSKEEARKTLMDHYRWEMKIIYGEKEYQIKNLVEDKVDNLMKEIYSGEPQESYSLDVTGLDEDIKSEVSKAAAKWDVQPKNGSISGFDKEKGSFIYSGEQTGLVINQEKLADDIQTQVTDKNFQAEVQAEAKTVAPEITEAQAKEMYQVIGTFTTTTTSNKDRNTNIQLASEAMNGMIIQPGEEFSFNKATGERSLAKGYKPAGAYVNGQLVEEPGGGVCQVSSTLYNSVVFSGLTTTERHAHSYEPSYVTPGEDAMVSYGGPDMKFVNNSPSAVAIRTSFKDRKLKISIVGIPILEKGEELYMTSQKTAELDPPAPSYEEDQTLQPNEEKVVIEAKKGSRWVTNLVRKKDGKVVSDEFFHNSTYRGKPATIKRNTSGVVIPAQTSEAAGSDSGTAAADQTSVSDADKQTQNTQPSQSEQPGPGTQTQPSTEAVQPTTQVGPGEQGEAAIPPNPLQ